MTSDTQSVQQLPAADGKSEPVSPPPPALLQFSALVVGLRDGSEFTHRKSQMTIRFDNVAAPWNAITIEAPPGVQLRQRYVVVLSPVSLEAE